MRLVIMRHFVLSGTYQCRMIFMEILKVKKIYFNIQVDTREETTEGVKLSIKLYNFSGVFFTLVLDYSKIVSWEFLLIHKVSNP